MKQNLLELTPVHYSASAIKVLHFSIQAHHRCFRLHWHDRIELLRIKRGKLLVECGTDSLVLSAGELMIIPPQTLHRGYAGDEMAEYDVIMFDIRFFYNETEICQKLLPPIFDGRAVFKRIIHDEETIACFDSICGDSSSGDLYTTAKIYQLIGLFYQNSLLEFRTQPKNASVKKIVDYLEENYAQELNAASLCEKFGYTEAHLCRKFKQATGLSPMVYLKIYRLEMASRKQKNRETSISDLAADCGFSDANYFTRCFKAHFGVPPTRYNAEQNKR